MLKQIIIRFLVLFLFCGCADGVKGYLKKSANNKMLDSKGFQGGKRSPLYNKKYIAVAKKNVAEENFDDDDDDLLSEEDTETINPTLRNRKMYLKMVKKESDLRKSKKSGDDQNCPSLNSANDKVRAKNTDEANAKLQKELEQIKATLNETKSALEKYSCSAQNNDYIQNSDIKSSDIVIPNNLATEIQPKQSKSNISKISSDKLDMKNKFLTEDYDAINLKDIDSSADKNININKVNSDPISGQEKMGLQSREI